MRGENIDIQVDDPLVNEACQVHSHQIVVGLQSLSLVDLINHLFDSEQRDNVDSRDVKPDHIDGHPPDKGTRNRAHREPGYRDYAKNQICQPLYIPRSPLLP